jgi:hypothetical protein
MIELSEVDGHWTPHRALNTRRHNQTPFLSGGTFDRGFLLIVPAIHIILI